MGLRETLEKEADGGGGRVTLVALSVLACDPSQGGADPTPRVDSICFTSHQEPIGTRKWRELTLHWLKEKEVGN